MLRAAMVGFFAVLIAMPVAAQAPAQAAQEITLDEAVRRALDIQPAMVQARGDQRNAGASMRTAFGSFLPTLTTGASAARSNVGRTDVSTRPPLPPGYSHTGTLDVSLARFDSLPPLA